LSADPRRSVLLLEAGGSDRYHWVDIPIGYLFCMGNPRTDWMMRTEPEPGLNGRALNYPRGKLLGGCSSINGMIYMRGQAADYDGWRQLGNRGWGWDHVLPYFLKSEDHHAGAAATMPARAISRSTSAAGCAGAPPRRSCARCCIAPTCASSPAPRPRCCCSRASG
jgi:choline dehydrogenase-like flavoprotein